MSALKDTDYRVPQGAESWRNPQKKELFAFAPHVIRVGDPNTQINGLMEVFGDKVTAVASHIVGNEQDGEEAAMDTFMQMYGQLSALPQGQEVNVSQRLVQILRSRSIDTLRAKNAVKRGRGVEIISYDEHIGRDGKLSNKSPSAEQVALHKLGVEEAVDKAFKEQPMVVYQAVGYTGAEISQHLGIPENTVKTRIKNWRDKQEEPDLS